jgi:rhodanese-related sulfurtransferase
MQNQKKLIIGGVILIVLITSLVVFVNSNKKNDSNSNTTTALESEPKEKASDMSSVSNNLQADIKKAIDRQAMQNVYLIDVRTIEEYNQEHAKGAMHWGLQEKLSLGKMPDIPKDSEIYIYCRSGRRASEAIEIMQKNGFNNLTNIRGLVDWKQAGGQTVSTS